MGSLKLQILASKITSRIKKLIAENFAQEAFTRESAIAAVASGVLQCMDGCSAIATDAPILAFSIL